MNHIMSVLILGSDFQMKLEVQVIARLQGRHDAFFLPTKMYFWPTTEPSFSFEDGRIGKNRLNKLHY